MQDVDLTRDDLGRLDWVNQYAAPTGGAVMDGVQCGYDDWGKIAGFEEDRDCAVQPGGNGCKVNYTYEKAQLGRNKVGRDEMGLPSGVVLGHDYSVQGRFDDEVSRMTRLTHKADTNSASVPIASYQRELRGPE